VKEEMDEDISVGKLLLRVKKDFDRYLLKYF